MATAVNTCLQIYWCFTHTTNRQSDTALTLLVQYTLHCPQELLICFGSMLPFYLLLLFMLKNAEYTIFHFMNIWVCSVWIVLGYMCFHASNINLSCAEVNTLSQNTQGKKMYILCKIKIFIKLMNDRWLFFFLFRYLDFIKTRQYYKTIS